MDLGASRRRYIRDRGSIPEQIFEAWIRTLTMLIMGKKIQGKISDKTVGEKEGFDVFESDLLRVRVPGRKIFWMLCGRVLSCSLLLSSLTVRLRSANENLFGPNQPLWNGDGGWF